MNFIDRFIQFFAPRAAANRAFARMKIMGIEAAIGVMSGRGYEGASKSSRLSSWRTPNTSANAEVRSAGTTLRDRARDLRRNNPVAARGIQVISTNVVGDGIRPQFNHTENAQSRTLAVAKDGWSNWAETPQCDLEGKQNIIQMQSLIMDSVPEAGDVFVIRHRQANSGPGICPLKLQILEADYLDLTRNEVLPNGNVIVDGIETDSNGRVVNYYFYERHPGDRNVINVRGTESIAFPEERVCHIFRKERPHQRHGVSWLAPVMVTLHELDIFQDATLKKQQIAACFSAFIYDAAGGSGEPSTSQTIEVKDRLDSGTVETLPPGKDIKFPNPPSAADYPEFTKVQLRGVSGGLGITYESLTNDYSNVNFSSGRMGFIEMSRNIRRWQSDILCSQFMDTVFGWWIEAMDLVTPGNVDMYKIWPHWTKPPREMIDPSKEVPAANEAIRSCQTTLSETLRSRGFDPDSVFQERAQELAQLKLLGIRSDSDPGSDAPPAAPKAKGNSSDDTQTEDT